MSDMTPLDWYSAELITVVPKAQYGISLSLDDGQGVPVLRMNNLHDGKIDVSDLKFSMSGEAENLLLQPNDVLFNRTNSIDHVGRTSVWHGELPKASFASYLVRLTPDLDKLDPEYLVRWLNLPQVQIAIRQFATPGVHQVNINPTNLRRTEICLPQDVREQQKIARILTTLDNLIEKTESLIAKHQAIKRGMMHDLFTRGVDAHGQLRPTRAEAPDLYKQSELGWIPKEWTCCRFGAFIADGPQNGLYKPLSAYSVDGFPIVRIDGFYDGRLCASDSFRRLKLKSAELTLYGLASDDILINRVNSIDYVGKSAIVKALAEPTVYESNIMRCKVDAGRLQPDFAIRLLCLPVTQAQLRQCAKSAVAQASINQADIRGCLLSVPPVGEQIMIVERFRSVEGAIESEKRLLVKLHLQKSGLMQDLLTGRVRVRVGEAEGVAP